MTPMKGFIVFPLSFSLLPICILSSALHSIAPTQSIVRDGETIVSAGGRFELGFFSPGNSNNRYLGIWYKQVSPVTAVWVANREAPLLDSAGVLNITNQGVLVLLNGMDLIIWSSSVSILAQSPTAELLDSGNFIVRNGNDANPENILWQSFDHPSDTLLPGMKLGWNRVTGVERYLSSWKSMDDPAPGDARVRVDPHRFLQLITSKGLVHTVSGPWNGIGFGGTPGLEAHPFYKFDFAFNKKEMYYSYQLINSSHISRCVLNQEGMVQQFLWSNPTRGWMPYISITMENCFRYAACGPFARCNINNSPICGCLPGFVPKSPKDREMADWSQGCIRTPLDCLSGDGFLKLSGLKLPDTVNYWYDESMKLDKCKVMCLKNCYCTAYANPDVRGGRGCLMWFDDLIDIRESKNGGQEIYIRLAPSELVSFGPDQDDNVTFNNESSSKKWMKIVVPVAAAGVLLLGLVLLLYVCGKKKHQQRDGKVGCNIEREFLELPLFDFATIVNATNNFSVKNKLGEGGFGPVYKGVLKNGQEIAVKRLSKSSGQGLDEFKNEVLYIVKLQHRNLVKLLGCCFQADEKMLVYEYMPNNSLDSFIFDERKGKALDWPKRFQIINGIARGLLYLHQDSRLRIIHRDLKASNVLLDNDMNPKISDFGVAKSFGGNETEAKTKRVIGTYGYMSPEYAISGVYSVKSDVFSFGVMVLEIVSGRRNSGFNHPDDLLNLIGHAWKLYMEGRPL